MTPKLTILIVGGYGTFGGRLVMLLMDEPRLCLIVAGRSAAKAAAFCGALDGAKAQLLPAAFDRDEDVAARLADLGPDILVDASGPFQTYGDRPYRLVEACLELGIDYLDLADAAQFVEGIGAFDERAKAAKRYVLSGASSCPALTAAAVRHLSRDLVRVTAIRAGITPSPRAKVGANVIGSIASYAGRRVAIRRNGHAATAYPFTEHMRFTVAPPGRQPLHRRLFSLVEVPDLRLLAEEWPDARTIWVGAGPVPSVLHHSLIVLAWLVRLRVVPTLSPLTPLMRAVMKACRWGEHRGGMFVSIEGEDARGQGRERSWHLVAEGDDGPFIPAMAVEAIIRRALDGSPPAPGARAALGEVDIDDYAMRFARKDIHMGVRDGKPNEAGPLCARILGEAWDELPTQIQEMHRVEGTLTAHGRARVERGTSLLARLAARLVGFPGASADTTVTVRMHTSNGVETWVRTFGDRSFSSRLSAGRGSDEGLIRERFGPLTFAMALVWDGSRLSLVIRGWRAFGIPLPLWLCPWSRAQECVDRGRFQFDVDISHPLTGPIVRYRGWLEPDAVRRASESVPTSLA